MEQTWQHITDGLCAVLRRDPNIRPDAFTEQFTVEHVADLLFSLMLSALLRQEKERVCREKVPSSVLCTAWTSCCWIWEGRSPWAAASFSPAKTKSTCAVRFAYILWPVCSSISKGSAVS